MLNLNQINPIAVDIGNQHIAAVQLKGKREDLVVRAMAYQVLDHGVADALEPKEALASCIQEIIKDNPFRGKRALIHIPSQHLYAFPISFKVTDASSIEEAIIQESGASLTFPVKEAVIDYPSIHEISSNGTKEYRAMIVAAQRAKVEQYLQALKQAGMRVDAVDFGLCSLIRLHRCRHNLSENPVILCHVGYTQSILAIVTKDGILAHRNVSWGMQPLLNRLRINLELSSEKEQAMELLKKYGLSYDRFQGDSNVSRPDSDVGDSEKIEIYRTLFQLLIPNIDGFVNELHQIIGYVRTIARQTAFEGISMYGHANSILHMDRYIEETLNIPTRCVNPTLKLMPSEGVNPTHAPDGASYALALGLAMRPVLCL